MITSDVIKELYKNYSKPPKHKEDLNLPYFAELLSANHDIEIDDMEVVVNDLDEFNPFRRFLIRSLCAVLEFDRNVAFVFKDHIIFFNKQDNRISVNFKPEKSKGNWLDRLLGH